VKTDTAELQRSLDLLVDRLCEFSRFPKYSLERRVDLFLAPFLEPFIRTQLDPDARLVAPEFPVLRDLAEKGPYADARGARLTRRTVNVDYLFHLPGTVWARPEWLFVELKTDARSFDDDQADLYAIARLRGMKQLRADLEFIHEKTGHRAKYDVLRDTMPPVGEDERLRIAYLAPARLRDRAWGHHFPTTDAQEEVCRTGTPARTLDRFFALEDLRELPAERVDPRFAPLWPTVRTLLDRILGARREARDGPGRPGGRDDRA
jgi:hypothetical protein